MFLVFKSNHVYNSDTVLVNQLEVIYVRLFLWKTIVSCVYWSY